MTCLTHAGCGHCLAIDRALRAELAQARERIAELEQTKGVSWHAHHDRAQRAEATLAKVREECEASLDEYNREALTRIMALLDGDH